MKRKLKKTVEEQLKEQGLRQVSIDELLCPKNQLSQTSKAQKNETTKEDKEDGNIIQRPSNNHLYNCTN